MTTGRINQVAVRNESKSDYVLWSPGPVQVGAACVRIRPAVVHAIGYNWHGRKKRLLSQGSEVPTTTVKFTVRRCIFVKTENVQQCRSRASEWLNKNGIRYFTNVYSINVDKRTCRVVFNSERDKKSAEGILARLRKDSKGKSKVNTVRPDARPYKGDVRKSYDEIKNEIWTYWQQYCTNKGFEQLIVAEHVWSKNFFILQRVSGKGADSKLFYEFTDPTNMESWLVFNLEQNP